MADDRPDGPGSPEGGAGGRGAGSRGSSGSSRGGSGGKPRSGGKPGSGSGKSGGYGTRSGAPRSGDDRRSWDRPRRDDGGSRGGPRDDRGYQGRSSSSGDNRGYRGRSSSGGDDRGYRGQSRSDERGGYRSRGTDDRGPRTGQGDERGYRGGPRQDRGAQGPSRDARGYRSEGAGRPPGGSRDDLGYRGRPGDDRGYRGRPGEDRRHTGGRGDRVGDDRRGSDSRSYRPDSDRYQAGRPAASRGDRSGSFDRGPGRRGVPTRVPLRPVRDVPAIDDDVTGKELDADIRQELSTLASGNAGTVARHLVMAGMLIDTDAELAHRHAQEARRMAGRVAVVREAAGQAAYAAGHYAEALTEFKAARRINGSAAFLPMMADSERGLGRPEKALEIAGSEDAAALDSSGKAELLIVAAGAHNDLGERAKALRTLQVRALTSRRRVTWVARLRYAYADLLLEDGRKDDAVEWFTRAAEADVDGETDADDRLAELAGVTVVVDTHTEDEMKEFLPETFDDERVDDEAVDDEPVADGDGEHLTGDQAD